MASLLSIHLVAQAKGKSSMKTSADQNLSSSQIFLNENQKKPGVVTLPSGLQYKILVKGQGQPPKYSDFVTVHYRGKLINGTEFDSSYARNEPATFAVNAVIPGWTEALQLMNPGSKWVVYIPPTLAYGHRGAGDKIGPNTALIFEIELIAVKSPVDANSNTQVGGWEDND